MKMTGFLQKAVLRLAGGVLALTLMTGIDVYAKEVTINSAGELQNALEEAKDLTETLTVTIPAGSDITIERFLYIYSDTVINAEGATIRNTNASYPIITHEGSVSPANVTINGGTWVAGGNSFIDLNGAANLTVKDANISGSGSYLAIIRNSRNVVMDNCALNGSCVLIEGGSDNAVKGSTLTGSNETAIQIRADGTVVENTAISDSLNGGIRIDNVQNVKIINNTIQNTYGIGIESVGGGNHTISGNALSSSGFMGIRVATDQNSTISGNQLIGNAVRDGANGEGLVVDESSKGTIVSGNTIRDTKGVQGTVGNGIIVNRSENITVSDNIVGNSANHGIQVSYQSQNVAVTGNTISASGRMGISVSRGAQADLKNNSITGSTAAGITYDGKEGTVSGSVEKCTISGSGAQGIYIESANVSMNGNSIANSGDTGLAITGSTVIAENNRIYQDKEDDAHGGIVATGGSKVTLNGNIISNFSLYGIYAIKENEVAGSNNQVNIAGRNFGANNIAYQIDKGISKNNLYVGNVERTAATASTLRSGCISGAVINGTKYETTTNDSNAFSVNYPDTDPAKVILYTQDAQGNTVCVQAPVNFSLQDAGTQIPDNSNREEVEAFVSRIYTVALGRNPEADGLKYWTDFLVSGQKTGAEVAQGFFFSQEFTNRKLTNEQYVDTLYRTMFDREADQGGKNGWLKDLYNGASWEYVYHGFAESVEFANLCNRFNIRQGSVALQQPRDQNIKLTEFVSRVYYIALNRSSLDEAGINDWCGRILNGGKPADIVWGIVFSNEFENRKLDDSQFVSVLYKTYFDREASNDPDGYNYWMNKLESGESRENIVSGFSNSVEFDNLVKSFGLSN